MLGPERHRDAGAYALGVLDRADAFRFEEHLAVCPDCSAAVSGFASTTRALARYAGSAPPAAEAFTVVSPALLDRLLAEVGRARRRGERARLRLVAASVVLAAAGAGAVGAYDGGGEPDATRLVARDAKSGVSAVLVEHDRRWGTEVGLEVSDPDGTRDCALVAVARDGTERTVTTWSAGAERSMTTSAGTALRPTEIDHFEVRTRDGERLVSLSSPSGG
ncbi:zf-HC2 domain-containing protein [Streptomyces triticagri]|uniref:Zf-HC2 domain-containing protein n=1 Tax=Streptomyces triticagri TaxID=2293568 RepID=A0A372LXI6_9ACTN|nr:zf-HC2 domain-containing protein [Streptomyces triticagri]RFU82993.1 zf-HC2 domain-containing protein [Streptomyces triticagri]